MKLNSRDRSKVFSFLIVLGMYFVISLVMTFMNASIEDGFVERWMPAWFVSFAIAYPAVIGMTPIGNQIADKHFLPIK